MQDWEEFGVSVEERVDKDCMAWFILDMEGWIGWIGI